MLTEVEQRLRTLLINWANKFPTEPLHYGTVGGWFDLDMSSPSDRNVLSEMLGNVAQFEYEHKRPFLSAIVTYSPTTMGNRQFEVGDDMVHGPGLVNRALAMGLDQDPNFNPATFGEDQQKECYRFWQNPKKYRQFK